MLPAEDLAGEVRIQQVLVEEQGDDAASPDLGEGRGGSQGEEEEAVVAVEAAFWAPDTGDALAPVAEDAKGRGGSGDEGEAESAIDGGVALLVGVLEAGEAPTEDRVQGVRSEMNVAREVEALFRTGLIGFFEIKDSDIRILTLGQARDASDKGIHV
jgi:hypothetical protein